MEAQYSERKNRIKLRVLTSTGLNLLCTANRSQKVKELLPHIIKLYEEVKEDQGLNDPANQVTKPFIKFIRKQEFLIAPSELVGDIFDDNDEVFCEIADQAILNLRTKTSKKQKQTKEQSAVKTQNKPSKTKKIKKKNSKQQSETKNKQKPPALAQKAQTQEQKRPNSTQKINVEAQNKNQTNQQKPIETKQKPTESKPSSQSKKKKNKKNNKSKPKQPVEQKVEIKETESKPVESSKPNIKKPQSSEQKSTAPLLSNDQLAKFRQLMKKSHTVENAQ